MNRNTWLVAGLGLLLAASAACGGGGSNATKAANSPPSAAAPKSSKAAFDAAAAMLLTRSDYGTGYVAGDSTTTANNALNACTTLHAGAPVTASVQSGSFSRDQGVSSLTERLAVFASPQEADGEFALVQARLDCFVAALNAGAIDTAGAKVGSATVTTMQFAKLGDRSVAYSVNALATAKDQASGGSSAGVQVNLVYFRKGVVFASLQSSTVVTQFDAPTFQDAAARAVAKVTP
jgi:hypothetical protein